MFLAQSAVERAAPLGRGRILDARTLAKVSIELSVQCRIRPVEILELAVGLALLLDEDLLSILEYVCLDNLEAYRADGRNVLSMAVRI